MPAIGLPLESARPRGGVLTDTAYASWSDVFYLGQNDPSFLYSNELMIGAPRTFSVMLQVGF